MDRYKIANLMLISSEMFKIFDFELEKNRICYPSGLVRRSFDNSVPSQICPHGNLLVNFGTHIRCIISLDQNVRCLFYETSGNLILLACYLFNQKKFCSKKANKILKYLKAEKYFKYG